MSMRVCPDILKNNKMCSYLKKMWDRGLFDEYSDDHFLILAFYNKLNSFKWSHQFINNNLALYPNIVDVNGEINFDLFSSNFCINFSQKLFYMSKIFGEDNIERFITDQLSAGKANYDEDKFFQALSEIEILSFFDRGFGWKSRKYEPTVSKNGKNPEACFIGNINGKEIKVNIEVKTAAFPNVTEEITPVVIPSVLQKDKCKAANHVCSKYGIKLINPRVTKLVQFLNSACDKFEIASNNEINLLYINWSFGDFPSNAFLEAWSLLTNEYNGLLTKPEIAKELSLREPLNNDVKKKISAVIVYVSSLDQLMFGDFRFVWQKNGYGPKFRLFLIDETITNIGGITGMFPDKPSSIPALVCFCESDETKKVLFDLELRKSLEDNMLK